MVDILVRHGARTSQSLVLTDKLAKNLAIAVYFLFYAACLPPLLVYKTDDIWTSMTESQKFGFMYFWAVIALLSPAFPLVIKGPPSDGYRFVLGGRAIWYTTCAAFFLVNHIVLPVLVIHANWQPFLTCKPTSECRLDCNNYTFLLPLVLGALEYVLGTLLYKYGDWAAWW